MERKPLWFSSPPSPALPALQGDLEVDVAVVGGGVAGLTAALLLQTSGKSVTLIDARRIGHGETGASTAHLTEILDTRYYRLESSFGEKGAALAAEASRAAINQIEGLALKSEDGGCGFARVPGYLFAQSRFQADELGHELDAMSRIGVNATWVEKTPLPGRIKGALKIERQAQIDPLTYLNHLAQRFIAAGGKIYENTPMTGYHDGEPCRIETPAGVIKARDVLMATQVPVSNRVFIHTKVAAYRSYAICGRVDGRNIEAGLYWDMYDPYHYIRTYTDGKKTYLIVGGEDHKTGQEPDTQERFRKLEAYTARRFGRVAISHRWSGQIIETHDGLPFLGLNSASQHTYIATGYAGNGMTFGTMGAMIFADAVRGLHNPYAELFQATRVKPLALAGAYLTENLDFPYHFAADRLRPGEINNADEIAPGDGKLLRVNGKMLAVSRREDGQLDVLSAVCTHLGCHVHWNTAERTWDCPCHGGRYSADGAILNGPPIGPLAKETLDQPEVRPRPKTRRRPRPQSPEAQL
ncbi:MAG: FAD-dependent oxidoreductase [Planctomycetes bacterium]|nr:FAD-dependent oxidoreductase [Planctomycetota bacterium]